jgi:hypothetical protein
MGLLVLGAIIGGVLSLATSWLVAERYFKKQRAIDTEKEVQDVELAYGRLVRANFRRFGKKLKNENLHEAMSDLEARLKVYNREFEVGPMIVSARELAERTIAEKPGSFEDI